MVLITIWPYINIYKIIDNFINTRISSCGNGSITVQLKIYSSLLKYIKLKNHKKRAIKSEEYKLALIYKRFLATLFLCFSI